MVACPRPPPPAPERAVPEVPPPCWEPLDKCSVWDYHGKPNLEALHQHFLKEGRLGTEDALQIIQQATALLRKEPAQAPPMGHVAC